MTHSMKSTIKHYIELTSNLYQKTVYVGKWLVCLGSVFLIWCGAFWFASLGLGQKQASVFFVMGFGGWLAACRYVIPGFWFLSIETVKRITQIISNRFL